MVSAISSMQVSIPVDMIGARGANNKKGRYVLDRPE